MRRENTLHECLKAAMHWLGKYCTFNPQVQQVENGEWLQFTVWINKKEPGAFMFTKPTLTTITRPIPEDEGNVITLNEWRHEDNASV